MSTVLLISGGYCFQAWTDVKKHSKTLWDERKKSTDNTQIGISLLVGLEGNQLGRL